MRQPCSQTAVTDMDAEEKQEGQAELVAEKKKKLLLHGDTSSTTTQNSKTCRVKTVKLNSLRPEVIRTIETTVVGKYGIILFVLPCLN